MLVIDDDDREVARLLHADGRERAETHQQLAVPRDDEHAPARLGEREAQPHHRAAAHPAPRIEGQGMVVHGSAVPRGRAQSRHDQRVAALLQYLRNDFSAIQCRFLLSHIVSDSLFPIP